MRTTPTLHALLPAFLLALGLPACGDKDGGPDEDDDDSGSPWTTVTACEGATDILGEDGVATGYVLCADGSVDRPAAVSGLDLSDKTSECAGTEDTLECTSDEDCTAAPNGICRSRTEDWGEGPSSSCDCVYACASDADCDSGEACLPMNASMGSASWNMCVPAGCQTDADCGTDGACGVSVYDDGCGWDRQLACRTPSDECRSTEDCAGTSEYCSVYPWDDSTTWTCNGHECDIGRPLLVDEVARTAPTVAGPGWCGAVDPPDCDGVLSEVQRRRLAAHWSRVAALEHASVASFARFSLQLLAMGAPAELLALAQEAGLDEVRHAQGAYALAARFAGEARGPGPLDLGDVGLEAEPEAVLRALVAEACVGETLGVAEAREALAGCTDPGTRAVLEAVVADETRHAVLAWKTLRWLLGRHPELSEVAREVALARLAALTAGEGTRPVAGAEESEEHDLLPWGLPGREARLRARRAAARGLVLPLLEQVLRAAGGPGRRWSRSAPAPRA